MSDGYRIQTKKLPEKIREAFLFVKLNISG